MELRCPSRIHGKIVDGRFEVKCASKHCGKGNGIVVYHYFNLFTGDLIETRRFQDPKVKFTTTDKEKEAAPTWR